MFWRPVKPHIRDFVIMAFQEVGINLEFSGKDENEIAKVASCDHPKYQLEIRKTVVKVDPEYYRPTGSRSINR